MDLVNKLRSILYKITNLRDQIINYCNQNKFIIEKEYIDFFIKYINEIVKEISSIRKEYYDTFIRSAKLGEIDETLRGVDNVKKLFNKCIHYGRTPDPNKIAMDGQSYQSILTNLNNTYKKIESMILYFQNNPHMIIEIKKKTLDMEKPKIQERPKEEKTDKKVKIKEESSKDKLKEEISKKPKEKEEEKSKIQEKSSMEEIIKELKEEKPRKKVFSIIFKIFLVVSIIFSFYLIFVLGRIIEAITLTILFYIAYSLFSRKSFGSIIIHLFSLIVLYLIIFVISNAEFSRVICSYTGTCPREIVRESEKEISKIKEKIFETINRIQKIMENPELYFIESRAEAQATRESYYYMFDIESISYIPPNYVFFNEEDKNMNVYPVTIFYTVRYSLPLDRDFNIKFDSYCLIIPEFDLKCLTDLSRSSFGVNKSLDGLTVFFDEKEHVFRDREVSKYGLQNFRCLIPEFTINIENCAEMSSHPFYVLNRFLVLLSNVTTRTVYKFLVAEESLLTKAILENKDLYFYLGLNRHDYDIGYFEGFLDYPKINIIRLGVLSEYPVIKFKDMDSISDVIYVSLPNIESLFDIKDLEVEIIYDPNQLDISLDSKFVGIRTAIYNFSCEKFTGKIRCKTNFLKSYDAFNRNRYIIEYKKHADKFFFFIPINISFSKNFVEYSEVVIQARATYGVENYLDNEIKYIPIKLQKI